MTKRTAMTLNTKSCYSGIEAKKTKTCNPKNRLRYPRLLKEKSYGGDGGDDRKESSSRPWSDLREELLEDIASHLRLKDYLRFAVACKSWRSIRHVSDMYSASSEQWLMMLDNRDGACELIDPLGNNKPYKLQFPELIGGSILSYKEGWMLLVKRQDHSFFLFEPVTRAEINLPVAHMCVFCWNDFTADLSASPASAGCVVTIICKHNCHYNGPWPGHTELKIQTWRPGDVGWTGVNLQTKFRLTSSAPVMSRGPFIWQGSKSEVRVFDPSSCSWRLIDMRGVSPLKRDAKGDGDVSALYITEFDDELFLVCVSAKKRSAGVYKIDPKTMKVKRIENLGSLMIYIDKRMALMAPAMTPEMANKIYFPLKTIKGAQYFSMEAQEYCPPLRLDMGMELLRMAQRQIRGKNAWMETHMVHIWVESSRFKSQIHS